MTGGGGSTPHVVVGIAVVALMASATLAQASGDAAAVGSHVTGHFRLAGDGDSAVAFAVEDAAGNLVMALKVHGGSIYATDGHGNGDLGAAWTVVLPIDTRDWFRVDVLLEGSRYQVLINQDLSMTAETLVPATAGRTPVDLPVLATSQEVQRTRQRVDNGNLAHDSTFRQPLGTYGWYPIVSEAAHEAGEVIEDPDQRGHGDLGRLEIRAARGFGVSYIQAPLEGLDGRYTAHISAKPEDHLVPPTDQAVLAGLRGPELAPEVTWSVVFGRPVTDPDVYALFYRSPTGWLTQVSPPYFTFGWVPVSATIDEGEGTVHLRVDGTDYTFAEPNLAAADHIGIGDVFANPLDRPIIGNGGLYDGAAVYQTL